MTLPKHPCNIDLSSYVALGDSITTGYMDGALYYEGQQHCYPAILAKQFSQKQPLVFTQPLMNPDSVGVNQDGESRLILKPGVLAKDYILTHQSPQGDGNALLQNKYSTEGPYQNMGVPGAKTITATMQGFGNPQNGNNNYNPFFTRMASSQEKASMLSDALLMRPTFFTLFIGNNDALAYGLSGGTDNAISTPAAFENSLKNIVNELSKHGAKGVIANLPAIAEIPYFTSIPYNGLVLNAKQADELNHQHASTGIQFSEGPNGFLIADTYIQPQGMRLIEKGELVLLDLLLDKEKDLYLTGKKPIPKKYTLTHFQRSEIEHANTAYNLIILNLAKEKQLAFVDIHALLKTAKPDRYYNPSNLNLSYERRGVFSLDGLHPNSFGQALMANEFIKTINETFCCEFNVVSSHKYKGIRFP